MARLPIEEAGHRHGNGHAHVLAEKRRPAALFAFQTGAISSCALHRRVDRGFLDYASYVIRDRAIPILPMV